MHIILFENLIHIWKFKASHIGPDHLLYLILIHLNLTIKKRFQRLFWFAKGTIVHKTFNLIFDHESSRDHKN